MGPGFSSETTMNLINERDLGPRKKHPRCRHNQEKDDGGLRQETRSPDWIRIRTFKRGRRPIRFALSLGLFETEADF